MSDANEAQLLSCKNKPLFSETTEIYTQNMYTIASVKNEVSI